MVAHSLIILSFIPQSIFVFNSPHLRLHILRHLVYGLLPVLVDAVHNRVRRGVEGGVAHALAGRVVTIHVGLDLEKDENSVQVLLC